jgi:hypothetical protein
MEKYPEVIQRDKLFFGRPQYSFGIRLEFVEQSIDKLFLLPEMVVKIAGTDIDFVGDLIGRGPGLAVLVEQQQAGNEDAVTGIASHPRTMGQKCS